MSDPTVIGAIATLLSTFAVVFGTTLTGIRERARTEAQVRAESKSVEAALRERLALRDEQLQELQRELAEREATIQQLRSRL